MINFWIDVKDVEKGARNAVVLPFSSLTKTGSIAIDLAGEDAFALKFGKTDLSGDIITAAGTTVARAAKERVDFSRFLEDEFAVWKRMVNMSSDKNPTRRDNCEHCHLFTAQSISFDGLQDMGYS